VCCLHANYQSVKLQSHLAFVKRNIFGYCKYNLNLLFLQIYLICALTLLFSFTRMYFNISAGIPFSPVLLSFFIFVSPSSVSCTVDSFTASCSLPMLSP
jgi:hypothetical protein